ncbi:MAG: hypothetical protein FWF67_02070 [Fibromonadales bacterium]|nr:hypothetical protein [Fibromonadales bacterium]
MAITSIADRTNVSVGAVRKNTELMEREGKDSMQKLSTKAGAKPAGGQRPSGTEVIKKEEKELEESLSAKAADRKEDELRREADDDIKGVKGVDATA